MGDDFEPGSATVLSGSAASRDCTRAQAGSCSLKLDPPCCSSYIPGISPVNLPIDGATTLSFYFYGESNGGNVDSDVHVVLDSGHHVVLHTTAGVNNQVSLLSASGHNVFSSWNAGIWTLMSLRFDPLTSRVTATVNGRSFTVAYTPKASGATSITQVAWYGVRWGSGTPLRYDSLRVENSTPVNAAPTSTLSSPADGASLKHGEEQRFVVDGVDVNGDDYYSVITVKDAGTGEVVATWPTQMTAPTDDAWVVADPPLPAGDYTWTARSTDEHGATEATAPTANRFSVQHLAYMDGYYVALGDSFSSGEGVPEFEDGTGSYGFDRCHRSLRSYSRLISSDANVPSKVEFRACSGANTRHVMTERFKNEDPQISHLTRLGKQVTLVTISVGGNDAGFAHVLKECIFNDGCEGPDQMDAYVSKRMAVLDGVALPPLAPGASVEEAAEHAELSAIVPLREVYDALRREAPRAEIVVLGYPKFFSLEEGVDLFGYRWGSRCYFIDWDEQRWMNDKVAAMNEMIKRNLPAGFRYADVENAFDGHHLCDGDPEWMHGAIVQFSTNPDHRASTYSFHPNAEGQAAFADVVRSTLSTIPPGRTTHHVGRGQTVRQTVPVIPHRPAVDVSALWQGSDIEVSLRSPSGRLITRDTVAPDVTRATGPTYDTVTVTDPEPGDWTVELFGAEVPASGEDAILDVVVREPVNQAPVATVTASLSRNTVLVDGGSSHDLDGTITKYVWDFGDEWAAVGSGATAAHTYAKPGTYTIRLTVYDDRGASTHTTLEVVVEPYGFTGFDSPINAAPTLNRVNAGRTVPVKWRLTEDGVPVSNASSFVAVTSVEVPCAAEAPVDLIEETTESTAGLKYSGDGWWSYTWSTAKAWAGTCRRMALWLDDGTTHSALFDFR